MFHSSVTDFNFGTETCDTSKYWKRWMVGRWMEPTESLVLCSKSFFSSSIFQIICLQRSRQLWYFHFSFLQRSQLKKWSQNHSLHDSHCEWAPIWRYQYDTDGSGFIEADELKVSLGCEARRWPKLGWLKWI